MVKGINFLSAIYHVPQLDAFLPVAFRLVRKTEQYVDKKDGKTKRRSPISKNEHYKLELLKLSQHLNHFALKSSIYLRALQVAFDTFRQLQPVRLAV